MENGSILLLKKNSIVFIYKMDSSRFKSDPYNQKNLGLTSDDVSRIGNSVNLSITVSDISIYQKP